MVHLAWRLATLSVLTALPTVHARPPSGAPSDGEMVSAEDDASEDQQLAEGEDPDDQQVDDGRPKRIYKPPPKFRPHHHQPMKIPHHYDEFMDMINLDRNGGKFIFAKFYIPNPGDTLSPHFHRLSMIYRDSADVDIISVDCEVHPQICETLGIQTIPYLLYWDHDSDVNGTMYEGYHTIQDMKAFIEEELGAYPRECDFHHKKMCSPRERAYLKDWEDKLAVHVPDNHLKEVERELKRLDKALKVKLTISDRHTYQWEVSMCVRLKKHIQGKLTKEEL
mmetsp:Transcript_23795/g.45359  ORF Transcript_23795/g.45359 Transcript_23795/m.45359 type:complete len:279 (+) Transcript_23795:97-933(+)